MSAEIRIGPLPVAYDDRVLEPRPWTEAQARWVEELHPGLPDGPVLELCTGAGHIGLLAALLTGRDAVLVDASAAACDFARHNARAAGLDERVEVRCADLRAALHPGELFPVVLADPPYIPTSETGRFPEDPVSAIDGGADGLALARTCLEVAARHVRADGVVLVQLRDAAQATALLDPGPAGGSTWSIAEVRTVAGRGALVHLSPQARPDGAVRT